MNKIAGNVLIAFMIMFTMNISAQTKDFRKVNWGADLATVKASETNNLVSEISGKVVYSCVLTNIPGQILYTFTTSGKLMRAKYYLTPNYINVNFYIRDYYLMLDLLNVKYGTPSNQSVKTANNAPVKEDDWAFLLSKGELRAEVKWSLEKTDLMLTLSRYEGKPIIQIDYISKVFNRIDLDEKKQIMMNDL